MVGLDLMTAFSFLQIFGSFPVFRKLSFKLIEEWLESSSAIGGSFQHSLHLLLGKNPPNKSFLTKLLEFCNFYLAKETFRAKDLLNCQPSLKLIILLKLLERQLVVNKQLKRFLHCNSDKLRIKPVGEDMHGHLYWYFVDKSWNVRIYQLKIDENNEEIWTLMVRDEVSFEKLIKQLEENVTRQPHDADETQEIKKKNLNTPLDNNETFCQSVEKCGEVPCVEEDSRCKKCGKINLNDPSNSDDDDDDAPSLSLYFNFSHLCSPCKHKVLIDNLEEKLLLYQEVVKNYDVENKDLEKNISPNDAVPCPTFLPDKFIPLPRECTSSCQPVPSGLPEDPTCNYPSSSSDVEDNETKDPTFDISIECPDEVDDDEDDYRPGDNSPSNKRKDANKEKNVSTSHVRKNQPKTRIHPTKLPSNKKKTKQSQVPRQGSGIISSQKPVINRKQVTSTNWKLPPSTGHEPCPGRGLLLLYEQKSTQGFGSRPRRGNARQPSSSFVDLPVVRNTSKNIVQSYARGPSSQYHVATNLKISNPNRASSQRYSEDNVGYYDDETYGYQDEYGGYEDGEYGDHDHGGDGDYGDNEDENDWVWEDYDESCKYEEYDDDFFEKGDETYYNEDNYEPDGYYEPDDVKNGYHEDFVQVDNCDNTDTNDVVHIINSDDDDDDDIQLTNEGYDNDGGGECYYDCDEAGEISIGGHDDDDAYDVDECADNDLSYHEDYVESDYEENVTCSRSHDNDYKRNDLVVRVNQTSKCLPCSAEDDCFVVEIIE